MESKVAPTRQARWARRLKRATRVLTGLAFFTPSLAGLIAQGVMMYRDGVNPNLIQTGLYVVGIFAGGYLFAPILAKEIADAVLVRVTAVIPLIPKYGHRTGEYEPPPGVEPGTPVKLVELDTSIQLPPDEKLNGSP